MAACANPPSLHQPKLIPCIQDKEPFGDCEKPKVRCPNEIADRFKRATVGITALPRFAVVPPPIPLEDADPTVPITSIDSAVLNPYFQSIIYNTPYLSNGFFVEKGYIVGSSAWLLAVVHALVLMQEKWANMGLLFPPLANGLPNVIDMINALIDGTTSTVPPITIDGTTTALNLMDYFDLFVSVYNVSGCPASYVYKARFIGADLGSGVAVYRIEKCDEWNRCLPSIENQPFLQLGESATYGPGNPAFLLGQWDGVAPMSFATGSVTDNSVVDVNGLIDYEGFATDITVSVGAVGAPILNQCAQAVAVTTGLSSSNTAFGVSMQFARPIICELIEADRTGCTTKVVYAPFLGFLIYRRAALGLGYTVLQAYDIGLLTQDTNVPSTDPLARFRDPQYCRSNRELKGLLVNCVSGNLACARTNEVCSATEPAPGVGPGVAAPCRLRYGVEVGDIILSLNGVPMGQLPGQLGPDSVLVRLCCGDVIEVEFLKAADNYTQIYRLCVTLEDSLAWINQLEVPANVPLGGPAYAAFLTYFQNLVPSLDLAAYQQQLGQQLLAYAVGYDPNIVNFPHVDPVVSDTYQSFETLFDRISYLSAIQAKFSLGSIQPCETFADVFEDWLSLLVPTGA